MKKNQTRIINKLAMIFVVTLLLSGVKSMAWGYETIFTTHDGCTEFTTFQHVVSSSNIMNGRYTPISNPFLANVTSAVVVASFASQGNEALPDRGTKGALNVFYNTFASTLIPYVGWVIEQKPTCNDPLEAGCPEAVKYLFNLDDKINVFATKTNPSCETQQPQN